MNIRALTMVAAGVVMGSAVVTASLWRDLRSEREVAAALRTELAASQARATAAQAAAPRIEAPPAPAPPATPAVAAAPRKADAPSVPTPAMVNTGFVLLNGTTRISEQDLMKDPEYRKARLAVTRVSLAQSYPGLVDELGLSKEEADQLFDLLAENQMDMNARAPLSLTGNAEADRATIAETSRIRQELQQKQNEAIRNMLGDARYQQWQDYQPTRSSRMQANSYATVMAQAGAPLDSGQLKNLATAVAAEQKRMQQDISAMSRTVDPGNPQAQQQVMAAMRSRQSETNQHILEAASAWLDPQQLAALRTQFEQQDAVNAASQRVLERTQALRPPQ